MVNIIDLISCVIFFIIVVLITGFFLRRKKKKERIYTYDPFINDNIINFIRDNRENIDYMHTERIDGNIYLFNGERDRIRIETPSQLNDIIIPGGINWLTNVFGDIIGANGQRFVDHVVNIAENAGIMDTKEDDNGVIKNDSQNVHDSGVQASIKRSVDNLKNVVVNKRKEVSSDVKRCINELDINDNTKKNAISSIDYIISTRHHIIKVNMNESEILDLVWSRITETNGEKYNNLLISLAYQLADMKKESGEMQCPTGRANRLINALNGIDSASIVSIKPKWALKREMLNKAAVIREKLTKEFTAKTGISEDEFENLDNYSELLNKELINTYKNDYKDILNEDEIKKTVISWGL